MERWICGRWTLEIGLRVEHADLGERSVGRGFLGFSLAGAGRVWCHADRSKGIAAFGLDWFGWSAPCPWWPADRGERFLCYLHRSCIFYFTIQEIY